MGDTAAERRRNRKSAPPELVAEAAANPGGTVASIDVAYLGDPQGYVPAEAVRGLWRVGRDGKLTGEYEENPNYGPPQDDFAPLAEPDHWLGWLGEDPARAVRDSIARLLDEQVPGAVLEWIKVVEAPRYLTGGRRQPDDDQHVIVSRAAMALPFALAVTSAGRGRDILQGVFSWAAVGLDRPGDRKDQVWFDLGAGLDWAEEQLRDRIYRVGSVNPGPTHGAVCPPQDGDAHLAP